MRRRKRWEYAVGSRGNRVVVYERKPGGPLYVRVYDPIQELGKGGMRRVSLGHRDKERAMTYAAKQNAELREGLTAQALLERVTLAHLFAAYQEYRTPRKKSAQSRADDHRRAEMWIQFLGARKDPHRITLHEWETFIDARSTGEIDARGRLVPDGKKRRPPRTRAVEADLQWLRWVLNWGARWREDDGRYLLRENAVRGYPIPVEQNPRRPVASHDRYEALRAVSDQVLMWQRVGGKRVAARSYLSELLDIVNSTGRRISPVCQLTYDDLRLNEGGPFGAFRWPADTDNQGNEFLSPMDPVARAAVERVLQERPGIGAAYLFPVPGKSTLPISRHLADAWLREGERLANLTPLAGSLWHAYRRKWVTERKPYPDVDIAAAGGWKDTSTLKTCYQRPDPQTILRVVLEPVRLREVK